MPDKRMTTEEYIERMDRLKASGMNLVLHDGEYYFRAGETVTKKPLTPEEQKEVDEIHASLGWTELARAKKELAAWDKRSDDER